MTVPAGAFDVADIPVLLSRTPEVLRVWLADLPAGWCEVNEGPDTFSPHEVLGHLIHGEQVDWIPRARIILEQASDRTFTPFDRFAHRRLFARRSIEDLLDDFTRLRSENVGVLRAWSLDDVQLDRVGRHPELGAVTLRQLLASWVVHDLGHLAQIARVLAAQYAQAVGPWEAYLPILRRSPPSQ